MDKWLDEATRGETIADREKIAPKEVEICLPEEMFNGVAVEEGVDEILAKEMSAKSEYVDIEHHIWEAQYNHFVYC